MKQCEMIIGAGRCIYPIGHGGTHFIPNDGRDHSDEIRIQVLRDRAESLEQQLGFLARDIMPALKVICEGFVYDPGHSDLDDQQPINVRMTLGDYRRASRLKYELERS